jgi:hypothetical protein
MPFRVLQQSIYSVFNNLNSPSDIEATTAFFFFIAMASRQKGQGLWQKEGKILTEKVEWCFLLHKARQNTLQRRPPVPNCCIIAQWKWISSH